MSAVSSAVPTMRAAAVISSVNVKAYRVVSTAVPPHLTFIDVFARLSVGGEHSVVVVSITALAVVPAGQVDTSGSTVTLHKPIGALVDVCLTSLPGEALLADTGIWSDTGASVETLAFTQCSAESSVTDVPRFTGATVSANSVEAKSVFVTGIQSTHTLIVLCAGVIINTDEASVTDAHKRAWCVHTDGVLPAVVFPLRTLVDILAVGAVVPERVVSFFTATASSCF